jgi:hypothetical protein
VNARICQNLSYWYFGPYEVEAKVGPVAYKLKLPSHSSIHHAFYVSLLKKVTGKVDVPFSPLPLDTSSQQQPEMVLDRRVLHKVPPHLLSTAG